LTCRSLSFGSVAYAHRRKSRKNRFCTVFRPFFTVFPADANRDSSNESTAGPFSRCLGAAKKRWKRPKRLSRAGPRADIEIGALVGGTLADVGVAVGAEHVDRAGDGLARGPLAGHQHDAGLHFVADPQHQPDLAALVEQADLGAILEAALVGILRMQDAERLALALAQEGDAGEGGMRLEVAGRGEQPQRPLLGVGRLDSPRPAGRA